MNEFDEFDELLNIEVRDQWAEIVDRAETRHDEFATSGNRNAALSQRRNGVLVLGAAAAIVALLAGLLLVDRTPDEVVVTPATEPTSTEPAAADSVPAQSPTTTLPVASSIDCGSQTALAEIGDLFRSGQPTYDYTAARDVAELVDWSEVVVTGTISSVQRQQGGLETYTVFDVADVEVLAGSGEVESFVTNSVWPFFDEPDPLGEPVALDGVRFVAFLIPLELNSAPSRWLPKVDGFAFDCDALPTESIAGLPPDAAGLSVRAIVDLVRSPSEGQSIMRPVFPPDVCAATSARGTGLPLTNDATFFARPSDNPIAIQIIGTDDTTPAAPFAWVQRSFGDNRAVRELRVFDNGNGEASWDIGDGSQGYLRTRGLDETAIREILDALTPLPADSVFPGFSMESDRWESLHETMNTDLTVIGARSECQVQGVEPQTAGVTLQYTVFAVDGDPILRYGAVIDRPLPLDVAVVGQTVIIVSGFDDPAAPNATQVTNADPNEWQDLLGRPTSDEQLLEVPPETVP